MIKNAPLSTDRIETKRKKDNGNNYVTYIHVSMSLIQSPEAV